MDFKLVNRLLSKLTLAMCGVLIIPLLAALICQRASSPKAARARGYCRSRLWLAVGVLFRLHTVSIV